jgi:DNA-binding response OmpR family regulator
MGSLLREPQTERPVSFVNCTGLQVLERLRSAGDNVPVILMTAFGDEDARADVAHDNVVLFDKPFLIDDLRAAVRRMLG